MALLPRQSLLCCQPPFMIQWTVCANVVLCLCCLRWDNIPRPRCPVCVLGMRLKPSRYLKPAGYRSDLGCRLDIVSFCLSLLLSTTEFAGRSSRVCHQVFPAYKHVATQIDAVALNACVLKHLA